MFRNGSNWFGNLVSGFEMDIAACRGPSRTKHLLHRSEQERVQVRSIPMSNSFLDESRGHFFQQWVAFRLHLQKDQNVWENAASCHYMGNITETC